MVTNHHITSWLALTLLCSSAATASAQGTAFNYQGKLNVNGAPANGSYDLAFELFSGSNAVNRLGSAITNFNTTVSNGLFAVTLDFGSGIFTGNGVWLQTGVRTNGGTAFTYLAPLQPILPVPYAIMANTASNLLGSLPTAQLSGSLPANQLSGTIPDGRLSSNVALLNGNQTFTGEKRFENPGNFFKGSFEGSAVGLSNVIPTGTLVLSQILSNSALIEAGFKLYATKLGVDWEPANASVPWGPRSYFGAAATNGQMWLTGGRSFGKMNDVWFSPDGSSWTRATAAAPWSAREGHMTIFHGISLYVMGGMNDFNQYLNDVWYSQGGTNWSLWTNSARWSPRWYSASVVFNGRIWVLGGIGSNNSFFNDVWYSPDGLNWIIGTLGAAWPGRQGHAAVVFNGKMWVMGGLRSPNFAHTNDVWSSSDGTNWTLVTSAAAWSPRTYFSLTAFDGRMWVMGGHDLSVAGRRNDVWSSVDGIIWTQSTNTAAWAGRHAHASLAFNDRLWVLGGTDNGASDVVWFSRSITNMLGEYYLYRKR